MITRDDQDEICRHIAIACFWGHGGIASVILGRLQEHMRAEGGRNWHQVYDHVAREATRKHIGEITDEEDLQRWLSLGYWLCNFDEHGCALFNPPPMNGLHQYVSKELAERHKPWRGF